MAMGIQRRTSVRPKALTQGRVALTLCCVHTEDVLCAAHCGFHSHAREEKIRPGCDRCVSLSRRALCRSAAQARDRTVSD